MFSLVSSFKAVTINHNREAELRYALNDMISEAVRKHSPKDDLVIYKIVTGFAVDTLSGFINFNGIVFNLVSGFGHATDLTVRKNSSKSKSHFSFDVVARAPISFYANMIVSAGGEVASTLVSGSMDRSDIIMDCDYDVSTHRIGVKQLNIKFGSLPKFKLQENGFRNTNLETILNNLEMRNEFLETITEPSYAYLMAYFTRLMSLDARVKHILRRMTRDPSNFL